MKIWIDMADKMKIYNKMKTMTLWKTSKTGGINCSFLQGF